MKRRTKALIGAGVVGAGLVVAAGSVAVAGVPGDDDGNEVPITGESLERASAVALDHLGEGRVTETEEGDEDSYYEVEVTLDNGNEVDVQLDRDFNVVGSEEESTPDDD
jgi:uncharacterized membrane protein YkoI